ncbi:MAG: oxidoreductase [Candidatus Cloacimonadota bacterium]|nr:MAG: oxidoreductase [Candidatus Cloacimonadota bacterium]
MLNLKNQFIFAPVKLGYSQDGKINENHLKFYEKRAKYLGAVTPEPLYIHKNLRELPTQMGIDNEDKIEGLKKLTALIHSTNTKAIAHLNHPGRMANPKIPTNEYFSSTDKACESGGPKPKKMDLKDIENSIDLFISAAKRAEESNFDFVELQFGHGYLVAQFISPKVNERDDVFGGLFENRIKYALMVLDAVRESISIPIIVRLSADEMNENGIKLEEMIKFSKILEERGVAAIHSSLGSLCSTAPWYFQHMFVPKGKSWELSSKIKEEISLPIISVGRINTFEDIEKVKNEYKSDYVAVGRALIADPDFIGKYLGEVKSDYVTCMDCAQGCLGGVKSGKGLSCVVNPEVGMKAIEFNKSGKHRSYAVVGGGLAGLEAALTLHKRGNEVTIFEKDKLGGQFNYAFLSPHKESLEKIINYYIKQVEEKNIPVIKEEAVKDKLIKSNFDEIVIATGSEPSIPQIEGLNNFKWAEILLKENLPKNKSILIIGGGLIGVDIATALIKEKNKVSIVKRTTDFGEDMEMISKKLSLKMMKENNTKFYDHTHIYKIDNGKIFAKQNDKEIVIDNIDLIVLSTGMKSVNTLQKELEEKIPAHLIGDAKQIGDAQSAISDGYTFAMNIN